MKNDGLTLKNIYRLLTAAEYPIYSAPVILERYRKGITLLRFWRQILPSSWKNTAHGKIIWREEGSYNRFTSEFCNHKKQFPYYKEYGTELLALSESAGMNLLIRSFQNFLLDRFYDAECFSRRITPFLETVCEEETMIWLGEITVRLSSGHMPAVWRDASLLGCLTLLASAGEGNAEKRIRQVCEEAVSHVEEILQGKESLKGDMRILTNQTSVLWQEEAGWVVYGREKELFECKEALFSGEKILVSGPGGIGKTELLRKLLSYDLIQKVRPYIAAVQFEGSLKESLVRSFLTLSGGTLDENYHECIYILEEIPEQTVLLIDNALVEKMTEEERQMLSGLSCAVLMTARQGEIPGFQPLVLQPVSAEASALIFRQSLGYPLPAAEKKVLDTMIRNRKMNFPSRLRFFGSMMRERGWDINQLITWLEAPSAMGHSAAGRNEGDRELWDIYRRSGLKEKEDALVRLLAVLPYRVYRRSFVLSLMPAYPENEKDEILRSLEASGWLEVQGDGYSMHPVLAESVALKAYHVQDLEILWRMAEEILTDDFLRECLRFVSASANQADKDRQSRMELLYLACNAAGHVSGSWSSREIKILACAVICLAEGQESQEEWIRILENAALHCQEKEEDIFILMQISRIETKRSLPDLEKTCHLAQEKVKNRQEPAFLYQALWVELIFYISIMGDTIQADQMLDQVFRWQEQGIWKEEMSLSLLTRTAELRMAQGKYEESIRWWTESARIAEIVFGEEAESKTIYMLKVALLSVFLGNNEEARKWLVWAEKRMQGKENWLAQREYVNTSGWLARSEGRFSEAIRMQEETLEYCRKYQGTANVDYLVAKSMLGTMLSSAGRREEALKTHEEAIRLCRKSGVGGHFREIIWNNAAVAFLDSGDTEKAADLLMEAKEIAETVGPLAVAENAWNRSRVFRGRGDPEQEKECLLSCLPVFEEQYGADHPKTQRVKDRLKEL